MDETLIRDLNYHVQVAHYINVAVWAGLFPDFGPNDSPSEQGRGIFLAVLGIGGDFG